MPEPHSTMRRGLLFAGLAGALATRVAPAGAASDTPDTAAWPSPADAPPVRIPGSHQFDVTVAGRARRLFVALPAERSATAPHPVLVVLDGNALFPLAAPLARNRTARPDAGHAPAPVVLGIGYPTDAPYDMQARADDYTLAPLPNGQGLAADRFLDFVEHDVQPWLARQWPIDAGRQTLFGHSYGGLLTLYALLTRPHLFRRYVAASPSIWWGERALLPYADRFAAAAAPLDPALRLVVTAGSLEEGAPHPDAERTRRQQARKQVSSARDFVQRVGGRAGLDATFRLIDDEDHGGVVVPSAALAARIACAPDPRGGAA
ncbi:alpha/beta hydrolase [Burkholderia stagnalis]|uniref:alpha/beta hydrolase n=2 Tax=Burkholderia stagnalis TaxID=1503054 RepID=UPI00075F9190|nr:alpha/beta hydrolase-fold protein [Burkholderia stagnalis]KWK07749.1 esterase [Burkholderia stagnalis]KWO29802.1 esterase [Burkholderia stagnalis]